jgi:hypothetical protein
MSMNKQQHVPVLLWPFYGIWWLISTFVEFAGRLVAAILGLCLMIVGVVVSLTIVGAIVGIPLAVLGFMMTIKALF